MTIKTVFAACLALLATTAWAGQEQSIFSSYTEEPTAGWASVSEVLAKQLVEQGQVTDQVDQCINEGGLARNYRQLLASRRIPLSAGKARFFLVRPASQPYCGAFYGAHTYTFWIMNSHQRVVFSSSADALDILPLSRGGMRDLLVSQCRGGYCYQTTFIFEKNVYQAHACSTITIASGDSVPTCPSAPTP